MRFNPAVAALAFLIAAGPLRAESTRTLEGELPLSAGGAFSLLNLAGTMTVVPAPGAVVVVRVKATVHAESDELAASVALTEDDGQGWRADAPLQVPRRTLRPLPLSRAGPGPGQRGGVLAAARSRSPAPKGRSSMPTSS